MPYIDKSPYPSAAPEMPQGFRIKPQKQEGEKF